MPGTPREPAGGTPARRAYHRSVFELLVAVATATAIGLVVDGVSYSHEQASTPGWTIVF